MTVTRTSVSTATVTTTTATVTTTTATQPLPASQSALVGALNAAIASAAGAGRLDPGTANDLEHRMSDLENTLATNPTNAPQKIDDLLHDVDDLATQGKLDAATFTRIAGPLNRLAALLIAQTPPH